MWQGTVQKYFRNGVWELPRQGWGVCTGLRWLIRGEDEERRFDLSLSQNQVERSGVPLVPQVVQVPRGAAPCIQAKIAYQRSSTSMLGFTGTRMVSDAA